ISMPMSFPLVGSWARASGAAASSSGSSLIAIRSPLLRKSRRIDSRQDPQSVLIVQLLEHFIGQIEPVHFPEGVILAVVVEIFVGGLEHLEIGVILDRVPDIFAEHDAVLMVD